MRLKKLLFLQHVRNILVLYRAIDFHDQQPDFCNKLIQGFVIFYLFQLPLAALGLPGLLTFMSLCWIQSLPDQTFNLANLMGVMRKHDNDKDKYKDKDKDTDKDKERSLRLLT